MWTQRKLVIAQSWLRSSFAILVLMTGASVFASTTPPHAYYVLSPEPLTGPISVMSLEPSNTISVGGYAVTLQQYESAQIPATAFTSGSVISGTKFFTVGGTANAVDLLVPDDFAGTSFVAPQIAGSHRYYFMSPAGTSEVTIRVGSSTYNVTATAGVVNEFDSGADNSQAVRITASSPIVLTHVADQGGVSRDAYPVPPAAVEVFGVRSQNAVLAALNDGTSVTVYASDGSSAAYSLNAGEQVVLAVGNGASQGQGTALHVSASSPIAAVQYDDGDGAEATAFWQSSSFSRRYGIPINAQYVAVACDQPSVSITLYRGSNDPQTQTCSGSSTVPGKAYFGEGTSGVNLNAGWYLISSSPVYVMYEGALTEDENNNLGLVPVAGPALPTVNSVASPTFNNPQVVSGTAGANQTVRLYVNGLLQATTTANGSGSYTFNAALVDGNNVLYATAVSSGNESDPSNAISIQYTNNIPRSQSGTISGTVVWTPGSPAQAYTITANLTVAAGAKLTLQPGTTLKFANGTSLTVTGELQIAGTAASPIVLTSSAASPVKGSWVGLVINGNTGSTVQYATIDYAQTGVRINGVSAFIRNSMIRNFLNDGVYVGASGASGSVIQGNTFNNTNDTGDCIETNLSSPSIIGNTLTNCNRGIYVFGAAAPVVNGNNLITGNNYGISSNGNSAIAAVPVVTGNQLYSNDTFNYHVTGYGSGGSSLKLNATGNWWGSADPTMIGATIYDRSEESGVPSVDYASFLSAPNGTAIPGNYLIGAFTASTTTLTAGAVYDVLGTLIVPSGKTLVIPAGTTLRFYLSNSALTVDGSLQVQGSLASPVVFTSGRGVPARNDWNGIEAFIAAASLTINYARIEWTSTAVEVQNATAIVTNSVIRYFTNDGVYVKGSSASTTVIQGNTIDNLNDTVDCIETNLSSPSIIGNTLTNCDRGIYVFGAAAPVVNGSNIITGNNYGISSNGNSAIAAVPVVTGNQLYSNDTFNYHVTGYGSGGSSLKLNATGNWWGSADPTTIGNGISDLTDSYTSSLPAVDYSGFLNGPNGTPVPGNYLLGKLTTGTTTLTAGTAYDVLGTLFVNPGATLIVPAGTVMRFHGPQTRLVADGTFNVQGTSTNPVILTSGRATPARNDWLGVLIRGNSSLIEYARIEYVSAGIYLNSASAIVRNNTIRYFQDDGVLANGAGASASVIQSNTIDNLNDTGDCIETNLSSPAIIGNTLTNCDRGIYVFGAAAPLVNGNNIVTGNNYGIYSDGNSGIAALPVVTGNQLNGNDAFNYYVTGYGTGGSSVRLNATGNWWGSTNPATIGNGIRDLTDNYTSAFPTVDYSGFLDGPNGVPVPGNYLIGKLTATTTLTAGSTYDVLGMFFVPVNTTLTIPAGTVMRFHGAATRLIVDGALTVQGTSGNPVILTSAQTTPARNDWMGVLIRANGSVIDYAQIEYAAVAINLAQVATVRNSTIRNFQTDGVYVGGGAASGSMIQGNAINNLNDSGNCIQSNLSSPTIVGNTLTNCDRGIYVFGAGAPLVNGNNIVTGNNYGIYSDGNSGIAALPVVTGNQLNGNDTFNYYVTGYGTGGSSVRLNATGNWWGSTNPTTIGDGIRDLTDNYTSAFPTVDYSGFLDGPNGVPVPGNYLIGKLTATTTLTAGSTYDVLGMFFVPVNTTLTIPAGTVMRFHGTETRLLVDGTLAIQGSQSAPVRLTSSLSDPARGAWYGIEVRATATNVVIDYAIIDWGVRAVSVTSANVVISNSIIRNFGDSGIWMSGASAASQISNNYIDNGNSTGYGIYLSGSSPIIANNRIYRTDAGIYLIGASNPTITGNVITNNRRGIVLDGNSSNSASAVPRPVITGNDIFDNIDAQIEVRRYGATNPAIIDATNNYFGTANPQAGQQIKFTSGSPSSALNFSTPASAPQNGTAAGNVAISQPYFSPNGDSIKDSTTVSGPLSQAASWTLRIRDPAYSEVRTFSGSGTSFSAVWDGRDESNQILADGTYTIELSVTDAAGTRIASVRLVRLDNTPPVTAITAPAAGTVLGNELDVRVMGSANDPNLMSFTLQYGAGEAPTNWVDINAQSNGIANGALGTWAVNSTDGTGGLPSGSYVLRLSTSDKAGNVGLVQVPLSLDLISIAAVSASPQVIRPTIGQQLQVNFTLSAPATVSLRMYPEQGGALVKEITQVFDTAGAKSLFWDGRNSAGAFVADEAYSYVLSANEGTRAAAFDPVSPMGDGSGSGSIDSSFNANRNDFWKMNYTMNHWGRIRLQVSDCTTPTHYPYNWTPYPPGTHPLIWDGRGADGKLVEGSCNMYFDPPQYMKTNSVIVRGNKPVVTGTGASPNIEVKSNPYGMTHSYEHVSRIKYRLDQDAYVTVKLLPPGISDPASTAAIVITNNELRSAQSGGQPIDHTIEWKGYEDLDTNNILVTQEGSYTFAIQATSVVTGATTLYRGVLQLWQ